MRTISSAGLKDTTELYKELLAGTATLQSDSSMGNTAKTELDEATGQKIVKYNNTVGGKEGGLNLGIILGHESFRDGVDNGVQAQKQETIEAGLGHMSVAAQIASIYGMDSLSPQMQEEVEMLNKAIKNKNENNEDLNELIKYVGKTYDSSADYWKLMEDGSLLRDGRSSLFFETDNGGEFQLWNMDGLSEEESFNEIVNSSGILSEEVQKRLGLFTITNAETNLSEEAFGQLAFRSYKVSDELGYFVDLSVVSEELRKKFLEATYITNKDNEVMKPDWNYEFNPESLRSIAQTYGTLLNAGMTFEYDNYFTGENSGNQNGVQNESVDELVYNMNNVINEHNNNLTSTGGIYLGEDRYSNDIKMSQGYSAGEAFSAIGEGIEIAVNYAEGTEQGFNVTDIQLAMWQLGNNNFFTAIKPELTSLVNLNGATTAQYVPHFYDCFEVLMDRSIKNYNNYLSMPDGFDKSWTKFWNNFKGWDY